LWSAGCGIPLFGKETLEKNPAIDFVVMGEGELTFNDLMDALK